MIAVDTSALMAILRDEPLAAACKDALIREAQIKISAATYAEALIVAAGRNVAPEMQALLDLLGVDVEPVTQAIAGRVADVYRRWGKGIHPASLNFGDCFAYDVAAQHGARLLYVGNDFARTDIESVL